MSKLFWLINLVLLATAGFATSWWAGQNPGSRWNRHAAIYLKDRADPAPVNYDDGNFGNQARHLLAPETMDELWQHTLFRPERTEQVAVGGDEQEESGSHIPNTEFELVGTGLIGTRAAAIILDKTPARRPRRNTEDNTEKRTQHVYRVDDQVGNTGYTIKEIMKGEVVLIRGDEERILTLESGDADSEKRRTVAAKAQEKKADEQEKEQPVKTTPTPPPPPPPPPMPAAGGNGNGATPPKTEEMTREERLKRAKEIRERMLERRRQQINSNN